MSEFRTPPTLQKRLREAMALTDRRQQARELKDIASLAKSRPSSTQRDNPEDELYNGEENNDDDDDDDDDDNDNDNDNDNDDVDNDDDDENLQDHNQQDGDQQSNTLQDAVERNDILRRKALFALHGTRFAFEIRTSRYRAGEEKDLVQIYYDQDVKARQLGKQTIWESRICAGTAKRVARCPKSYAA
ncbi:hypothetical protein ARSEF1564_005231 [Beauveria bassiana]